jgi:hypothetical protein
VKDIIRWLETKLFRSKPVNPPIESVSTDPDEPDLPKDMQDLVSDAPQPDSVDFDLYVTAPNLILDEPSSSDADEPTGIDPYDTAKLHKK